MMTAATTDALTIERRARALRAQALRDLFAGLRARLRAAPATPAARPATA